MKESEADKVIRRKTAEISNDEQSEARYIISLLAMSTGSNSEKTLLAKAVIHAIAGMRHNKIEIEDLKKSLVKNIIEKGDGE